MIVAVRYSYEKKPAGSKRRVEMAKALLREALDRLEGEAIVDVGFSEDALRRVRTDKMEA